MSAIGYTAILKNGDTIKVTKPNKGIFYINGTVRTNDYTYTGDGYEVVNVWCFEDDYTLELNDTPTFDIQELYVRNLMSTPVVSGGYKDYATTLKTYNFSINGRATRKLISNGAETLNPADTSTCIEEIESDCITANTTAFINRNYLKYVNFPNLKTIPDNNLAFLGNCTNAELKMNFPKLETIGAGAYERSSFNRVVNLIIPSSVKVMGRYACTNNSTIILNCNRAISIDPNWCWYNSTPPVNFTMCEDWQASINIAAAAKNHTVDWFIDLFTNKLADMTGQDTRQLNIPLAIFEALSPEQLAIAQNKNWTVTGL